MSENIPQSPYNFERLTPAPPPKRKRPWLAAGLVGAGTLVVGFLIGNAGNAATPANVASTTDAATTVTITAKAAAPEPVTKAVPVTKTVRADKTVSVKQTVRVDKTVRVEKTVQIEKTVQVEKTVEKAVPVTTTVQVDRTIEKTVEAAAPNALVGAAPDDQPQEGNSGPSGSNRPADAPIKGNASSMIYHMPGGEYYDRTVPEQCFATEDQARAAGYRASKR